MENKKLKIGIIALAVIGGIIGYIGEKGKKKEEVINPDTFVGASALPMVDKSFIKNSEVTSRYFARINGEDKFIGYYAKHKKDGDTYYSLRVTGKGSDKKWFTSDDRIKRYYVITDDKKKNKSKFTYENIKKGTPYFGGNDIKTKGVKAIKFNNENQILEEENFKLGEKVGESIYTYNTDGSIKEVNEVGLNNKTKNKIVYTNITKENETIIRQTYFNSEGNMESYRDSYTKGGKIMKVIKYDYLKRQIALEIFGSSKKTYY